MNMYAIPPLYLPPRPSDSVRDAVYGMLLLHGHVCEHFDLILLERRLHGAYGSPEQMLKVGAATDADADADNCLGTGMHLHLREARIVAEVVSGMLPHLVHVHVGIKDIEHAQGGWYSVAGVCWIEGREKGQTGQTGQTGHERGGVGNYYSAPVEGILTRLKIASAIRRKYRNRKEQHFCPVDVASASILLSEVEEGLLNLVDDRLRVRCGPRSPAP